jgi:tRNA pseudouridine38-40 synthase
MLEYDGSKYSGWQEQKNARTVMGVLREAVEESFEQAVEMNGAGRTDAGVHARGQVANVRVLRPLGRPVEGLLREMNLALPADVAVIGMEAVPLNFHARHSALARAYVYQIARRKSAFTKKYAWWIKESLDEGKMREAAAALVGRHDFRNFQAIDPSKGKESTIVVVERAELVERVEEGRLDFEIEASHFLWRMVRRVTGTLVKVGLGEVTVEEFRALLQAPPPPHIDIAAWTAPAAGLFLEKVRY